MQHIENSKSHSTAWKVPKGGVIFVPYFPVLGPEKTLYLHTFHTVLGCEI